MEDKQNSIFFPENKALIELSKNSFYILAIPVFIFFYFMRIIKIIFALMCMAIGYMFNPFLAKVRKKLARKEVKKELNLTRKKPGAKIVA